MLALIFILYLIVPDAEAITVPLDIPVAQASQTEVVWELEDNRWDDIVRIAQIVKGFDDINKIPVIIWGIEVTDNDIQCLADNIYFEARGEPIEGQYAVAEVVINRTKSAYHPDDICGVVHFNITNPRTGIVHACAFAWTCDNIQHNVPHDTRAIIKAFRIAVEVLFDPNYTSVFENHAMSTHFHADWITPWWSVRLGYVASIGNHKFYD